MKRLLASLSSLRLTLFAMLALILVIVYDLEIAALNGGWLAGCFGLLALNLAAAIAVRTQFQRQPGLLVFHLCLLTIAGLAAVQTMTGFEGRIELAEKQAFSVSAIEVIEQGPWHPERLKQMSFVQGPVSIDYSPGLRRGQTHTEVFQVQGSVIRSTVFGDTQAFHERGYRFVTTANKGFALTLTWLEEGSLPVTGNIHMPSFPVREWNQQKQWLTPAGETVLFELETSPVPVATDWTLSSTDFDGQAFVSRQDGTRIKLDRGSTVTMAGGKLRLDDVVLWIGYRIESNLILPWLFVSAVLGTIALAWHFWQNPPELRVAG